MVCSKCHRQHGRFQNGKMKKTCPTPGGRRGGSTPSTKLRKQRAQSGEGPVGDAVVKNAAAFAKWYFKRMEAKRKKR